MQEVKLFLAFFIFCIYLCPERLQVLVKGLVAQWQSVVPDDPFQGRRSESSQDPQDGRAAPEVGMIRVMLATRKQIEYLQSLTDRAERIKQRHPSLIPMGLYYKKWDIGMTSERAGHTIDYYKAILAEADKHLYRRS